MSSFIAIHIISNIEKIIKQKERTLKHNGFYYFDIPIRDTDKKLVNRVNRWCPYIKGDVLPVSWYLLNGGTLLKIFTKLKNNEFYIYKKIDGKDSKVRIKNEVK